MEAHQTAEGQIKSKMVSFRVSDQEYEKVEKVGRQRGFASVSLFARAAVLKGDSPEQVNTTLDVELNRLWRRMEALAASLEEMAVRLGTVLDRFRNTLT